MRLQMYSIDFSAEVKEEDEEMKHSSGSLNHLQYLSGDMSASDVPNDTTDVNGTNWTDNADADAADDDDWTWRSSEHVWMMSKFSERAGDTKESVEHTNRRHSVPSFDIDDDDDVNDDELDWRRRLEWRILLTAPKVNWTTLESTK